MNSATGYQDIFQALKGISQKEHENFTLCVDGFPHVLVPVKCREGGVTDELLKLLTCARNENKLAFLTRFCATTERTKAWLTDIVGPDTSRILFVIKNPTNQEIYGYMGLAYGKSDGTYIEADAIVRTSDVKISGLMKAALLSMIRWANKELGIADIWVRVLSDNPAIAFYKSCGFKESHRVHLFETSDKINACVSLSEARVATLSKLIDITLVYMRHEQRDIYTRVHEKFLLEIKESVSRYSQDEDWLDLSNRWLIKGFLHRYMYNFGWMGRPIIQIPNDMVAMQELIWEIKPDLIIETGIAHGGSLIMSASMLALLDLCEAIEAGATLDPKKSQRKVLGIDIDIRAHNRAAIEAHPMASRIQMIQGSSIAPDIVDQVRRIASEHSRILVCLDSNHTHDHVFAELEAYALLTSVGSYCVVFDTIIEDMPADMFPDRPWGPGNNPKTAVFEFLKSHAEFEADQRLQNKLMITVAPNGYLKRIS